MWDFKEYYMGFLATLENLPEIVTIGIIVLIIFAILIARLFADNHYMSKEIDELRHEISDMKKRRD